MAANGIWKAMAGSDPLLDRGLEALLMLSAEAVTVRVMAVSWMPLVEDKRGL